MCVSEFRAWYRSQAAGAGPEVTLVPAAGDSRACYPPPWGRSCVCPQTSCWGTGVREARAGSTLAAGAGPWSLSVCVCPTQGVWGVAVFTGEFSSLAMGRLNFIFIRCLRC